MDVIAVTNDPVRISFVTAVLRHAGIEPVVLDAQMSALEGSIGAIPRRIAVAAEDALQARRVLREAGIGEA